MGKPVAAAREVVQYLRLRAQASAAGSRLEESATAALSAALDRMEALEEKILFCSVLSCSVLLCSVLSCPVLSCSVLFCSVLFYSTAFCCLLLFLFCSVLFCFVLLRCFLLLSVVFSSVLFHSVVFCGGQRGLLLNRETKDSMREDSTQSFGAVVKFKHANCRQVCCCCRHSFRSVRLLTPTQISTFPCFFWVAVKELKLSYQNSKTILFTIYPYYGILN